MPNARGHSTEYEKCSSKNLGSISALQLLRCRFFRISQQKVLTFDVGMYIAETFWILIFNEEETRGGEVESDTR